MSGAAKEWLIVLIFFAAFFAYTFAEAAWINKRTAATYGRSLFFTFTTNLIVITVGFVISFVTLGVILAMAWDGSLQNVGLGDTTIWTALAIALLFPVLLLFAVKRIFIAVMKFEGISSWRYSAISSVLFFLAVYTPPFAFAYLF